MRSWKNVRLERIATLSNAKRARHEAGRGKRNRSHVKRFNDDLKLMKIIEDIKSENYKPQELRIKKIWDKASRKERIISCPAFRDQIVHWMIMNILKPHFERHIIQHAVANIPGKGLEYGRKLLKHWAHKDKHGTKWVVKMDIRKYYPSIDVEILLKQLSKHIQDKRVIELIRSVLSVSEGLTLGSYFNQWAAIFYLSDFDHYIKEQIRCKYYLRYVDDIIMFFPSKKKAKRAVLELEKKLNNLKLVIKKTGPGALQIYKFKDRFIDALGYRTYRDGKQTLRRRNYLTIKRLYNRIKKNGCCRRQALAILSKRGLLVHSNCNLLLSKIDELINTCNIKGIAYEKHYQQI
jgi:hypothetical protein